MKISKLTNGNVQMLNENGTIIATLNAAMNVFINPRDANSIFLSDKLNPQKENDGYLILVNEVTATIKGGVTTAFTGTRDDLMTKLSQDFFFRVAEGGVTIPSNGLVKFTPATGSAFLVAPAGTTCSYNFTATDSGLWDIESNIIGWDDLQSNNIAILVEILQGTTVLDTFQLGGLSGNHLNNNWMFLGRATNRLLLTGGVSYTIRATSNGTSPLDGVGIQNAILRLVQNGAVTITGYSGNSYPVARTNAGLTRAMVTIPKTHPLSQKAFTSITMVVGDRRNGFLTREAILNFTLAELNGTLSNESKLVTKTATFSDGATMPIDVYTKNFDRVESDLLMYIDDRHANQLNTYGEIRRITANYQ